MISDLFIRELKLADIILIAIVIMGIGVSAIKLRSAASERFVYIYKDSHLLAVYPLNKNRTIKIDEHNSIQISGARVRMIYADCPDNRCMKQGWTTQLPIICLPNRLMIEIKSQETERKLILQ